MRQIAHGGDPFENGSARPLDYGHWSAHKLEALTSHELRHGEAVAIGLALDARYSVQVGMLPAGGEDRVHALLKRLGFHLWHAALESRDNDGHWLLAARPRGVPRASRRRAHDHAAARPRRRRRGAPDGPGRDPARARLAAAPGAGRVNLGDGVHLTYCSNIHPGESWAEVRANFDRHVVAVRDRLDARRRVSASASGSRRAPRTSCPTPRARRVSRLPPPPADVRLHAERISLRHVPRHARQGRRLPARLARSRNACATPMARGPAGRAAARRRRPGEPAIEGSVSTVPGAFKPALRRAAGDVAAMVEHMLRMSLTSSPCASAPASCRARPGARAALLPRDRRRGRSISSRDDLHGEAAVVRTMALTGLERDDAARRALHEHLGICLDLCHAAVEFEDAADCRHSPRPGRHSRSKMQISAGLRLPALDANRSPR